MGYFNVEERPWVSSNRLRLREAHAAVEAKFAEENGFPPPEPEPPVQYNWLTPAVKAEVGLNLSSKDLESLGGVPPIPYRGRALVQKRGKELFFAVGKVSYST